MPTPSSMWQNLQQSSSEIRIAWAPNVPHESLDRQELGSSTEVWTTTHAASKSVVASAIEMSVCRLLLTLAGHTLARTHTNTNITTRLDSLKQFTFGPWATEGHGHVTWPCDMWYISCWRAWHPRLYHTLAAPLQNSNDSLYCYLRPQKKVPKNIPVSQVSKPIRTLMKFLSDSTRFYFYLHHHGNWLWKWHDRNLESDAKLPHSMSAVLQEWTCGLACARPSSDCHHVLGRTCRETTWSTWLAWLTLLRKPYPQQPIPGEHDWGLATVDADPKGFHLRGLPRKVFTVFSYHWEPRSNQVMIGFMACCSQMQCQCQNLLRCVSALQKPISSCLRVKSELNSGFRSKDANSSKLFWVRHPDILRRGIAHAERMKIRLIWNLEYISNGTAGPLPLDSQTHWASCHCGNPVLASTASWRVRSRP